MGMAGWEWEGNGNKTRLNLGLGMGINHWEWEGMGLKKIFPLISTHYHEQSTNKRVPYYSYNAYSH